MGIHMSHCHFFFVFFLSFPWFSPMFFLLSFLPFYLCQFLSLPFCLRHQSFHFLFSPAHSAAPHCPFLNFFSPLCCISASTFHFPSLFPQTSCRSATTYLSLVSFLSPLCFMPAGTKYETGKNEK